MKDTVERQHIIYYNFMDIKPPRIKRPRTPNYDKDIDRIFDDLRKIFDGGYKKRYVEKKEKPRYSRGGYSKSGNNNRASPSPTDQRCMVKMIYSDDKKGHLKFLTNYMPQMNKDDVIDKPVLFNANTSAVGDNEIEQYKREMTDRHFKFIISPESTDVPIRELVRSFMSWLEMESGHKLMYLAVEHRNTDHPHAHILINGKDKRTHELIQRFDRKLVSQTARLATARICTSMIGQRTRAQISTSLNTLPLAKRHTTMDDKIESRANIFDHIITRDGNTWESSIVASDEELKKRLDTLCDMGLARKFINAARPLYYLETGWANKLRSIGRYNTFLDARKTLRYTSAGNLQQYTGDVGTITGVITRRITMDDENVWNNAIVIEDRENSKAWYIPLSKALDERYLGAAVECNATKGQNGKLHPTIRIIGDGKEKTIGKKR